MVDRLKHTWNADPNGELVVKIFEEEGLKAKIKGLLTPRKTIDVPFGMTPHLYEPVPMKIRSTQRMEVIQDGSIIMRG